MCDLASPRAGTPEEEREETPKAQPQGGFEWSFEVGWGRTGHPKGAMGGNRRGDRGGGPQSYHLNFSSGCPVLRSVEMAGSYSRFVGVYGDHLNFSGGAIGLPVARSGENY